jgi:hypothetical protein
MFSPFLFSGTLETEEKKEEKEQQQKKTIIIVPLTVKSLPHSL